jgi:hypothetical protein
MQMQSLWSSGEESKKINASLSIKMSSLSIFLPLPHNLAHRGSNALSLPLLLFHFFRGRAKCESAARTIEMLLEENTAATEALNHKSDEVRRLRAAMATAAQFVEAAETDAVEAERAAAAMGAAPSPRQRALSSAEESMDIPQGTEGFGASRPLPPQLAAVVEQANQRLIMSPEPRMVSPRSPAGDNYKGNKNRRRGGGYSFWQWVAGADIADVED